MPPSAIEALAHRQAEHHAHPPSPSPFAGVVDDVLRSHIQRVARQTLTANQLAIFERHSRGMTTAEITTDLGKRHRYAVHGAIHGTPPKAASPRGEPGIMAKMQRALAADPAFLSAATTALERVDQAPLGDWFAASRGHPDRFVPLAVLLVIFLNADSKREARFDDLLRLCPRMALDAGLHWLRGAGFIMWDGVTARIIRTPLEPEETRSAF